MCPMNASAGYLWSRYKSTIELLSQINNSFVYVGEYRDNGKPVLLYVSPSFESFFDWSSNDVLQKPSLLLNAIHPEDMELSKLATRKYIELISSAPVDEKLNYKIIYETRVKNPDNEYKRIIIQEQILELSQDGLPWIMLGIADLAPNQTVTETLRIRLINFRTGQIVPFSLSSDEKSILTSREKEILKLIDEGRLSKEISDMLSISLHTVNRHRQNILQKLNADNSIEAIHNARSLGLIE